MNELSLFTGAGGGVLASKLLGWTTIGYVEYDDYCQRVIAQRIKDGIFDEAPIFGDVREFAQSGAAEQYRGFADVVTAGFPCQPHSSAARGRNKPDEMWAWVWRIISLVRPTYVFCENVSRAAIQRAGESLCVLGYKTKAIPLAASDLGSDHIRQRYWLLAHANSHGELCRQVNAEVAELPRVRSRVWETAPEQSGMVNGLADRTHRLKAIGNGQVPVVAATAWRLLSDVPQ